MSKFIKAIKAELNLEKRYPGRIKIKNLRVREELRESKYDQDLYGYTIRVEWEVNGECHKKALEEIKKQCICRLRDEIYGDLKEMVFELYQAVHSEDEYEIEKCLGEILDEVNGKNE